MAALRVIVQNESLHRAYSARTTGIVPTEIIIFMELRIYVRAELS